MLFLNCGQRVSEVFRDFDGKGGWTTFDVQDKLLRQRRKI